MLAQQHTLQLQHSNTQTINQVSQGFEYGLDLYGLLNGLRASFKKRNLWQDYLGEIALNELVQTNVSGMQDLRFVQTINKYSVSSTEGVMDYIVHQGTQNPMSSYQGHTDQEIKNAFEKVFDEMTSGVYRMRLLQSYQYTHISFACLQHGQRGEYFKIAVLATKKCLSIEGFIQCCTGIRSSNGTILVGKVFDQSKKPYMLVINRGSPSQVVVGHNRIGYSQEEGEYRIGIPEEYQGHQMTQVLPNSIIEIIVTSNTDQSFIYGQGCDLLQGGFQQISGEVGISDIVPDQQSSYFAQRVVSRNDSLQTAFNLKELLKVNESSSNNRMSQVSFPVSQGGIRKTQLQIQKEQSAALMRAGTSVRPPLATQSTNSIQFNRSQTSFVPSNTQMKAFQGLQMKNENINPNLQMGQPPKIGQPIKFQLNPPAQQQAVSFSSQPHPLIKFNLSQSQQSTQPLALSTQTSFNTWQQPPKISFNQPPIKFTIPTPCVSRANTINQNPPLQPKITFKYGPNNQQVPPQTQPSDFSQRTPVYNELSLIDQQTLQGYLKQLQEDLTPEQTQRVTTLMLTDPIKFYEYFQIAHDQLKSTSKSGEAVQKQKAEEKKKEEALSINDYDDMGLFLLSIPETLIDPKMEKFADQIKDLKTGKLVSKQLIRKLLVRASFPTNESFAQMLSNSRETGDMILELKQEEFACHKIVITSTSDYFKKALKENELINKHQYHIRGPYKQRLIVPNWMDSKALRLFINYCYTGSIGLGQDGRPKTSIDPIDIINLLKIGNFFYHQYIQETLIADYLIPNMNPQQAVIILKECFNQVEDEQAGASTHRKSCTYAWAFLNEYSQFYLQKHLSTLLRSAPQIAYELPGVLLRKIIDKSLLHLVDNSNKDLETILQFTAETWTTERTVSALFKKSQATMDSCSAFDQQHIPQIGDFIKQTDPKVDYQCKLVQDETMHKPKLATGQNSSPLEKDTENPKPSADSTFYNANSSGAKIISEKGEEFDLASWKPSSNLIKQVSSTDQIFDKEPQYQTTIQLDDPNIKQTFEKNKGMTIFSKAFDFGRRSWMLKLDLDSDGNISPYIVERGSPLGLSSDDKSPSSFIGQTVPIKFSSLLVQFEIQDPSFGEHKSYFFFSFAHGQNQVIGHENILNLSQMQNKSQVKIKVYMKEFLMHSALMWYLSQKFEDLYSNDLKQMEIQRKNQWPKQYGVPAQKEYEILGLRFYTIYQLLQSNHLKIEGENLALGFVFHFTKLAGLNNTVSRNGTHYIADVLSTAIRFQYVATNKILSALRDNDFLRQSQIFTSKVREEFSCRAMLPHSSVILSLGNNAGSKNTQEPRKYYDAGKLSSEGRSKYQNLGKTLLQGSSLFIEELIEWLKTSKHMKVNQEQSSANNNQYLPYGQALGDPYTKQEILRLQALYYEERRKALDLQGQVDRYQRRNEELEKLLGQDYWKLTNNERPYRRSHSIEKLRRAQTQVNNQRVPGYYSPPNRLANYISNKDILKVAEQKPQANNSFDQSQFFSLKNSHDPLFDQTCKPPQGGSTHKADRKLIQNQYADMSRLLNKIDNRLSPQRRQPPGATNYQPPYNPAETGNVPYYRRVQPQRKDDEGECRIF